MPLPQIPPRLWPRFTSPLHSPAVVARVGRVLGVFFAICFVTGLLSHYRYHPWHFLPIPAAPVWGYRLTQGLHVITGIATLPLLLIKLWTVYPRLFEWPPARSLVKILERLSIAVLVSTASVEIVIGLLNILQWYPWKWSFVFVHYTLAYVSIGALILHIAVKLPTIQQGLATPLGRVPNPSDPTASDPTASGPTASAQAVHGGLSRRGLITAAAAGVTVVATVTVGQVITPLESVALLAPRRPKGGQLGVPINRTAVEAATTKSSIDPSWRLTVIGLHPFDLTIDDVEALAQLERTLPIACVEGWSIDAHWRGVSLLDLVHRVGGNSGSRVQFDSLEREGPFRQSSLQGPQVGHALLATHLNGARLTVDHGYPLRLIAPDHPGVFNTKWLDTITVV
ncbi:MAG: molybdopterin-dependent oxidoreductase [Actinomycetota bacterium]|nr:molybdopterin-dependent oxidoreductase [Actinomycetota bacterium]